MSKITGRDATLLKVLQDWAKQERVDLNAMTKPLTERAIAEVGLSAQKLAELLGHTTSFTPAGAAADSRLNGDLNAGAVAQVSQREVFQTGPSPVEALKTHGRPGVSDYVKALVGLGFAPAESTALGQTFANTKGQRIVLPSEANGQALGYGGDEFRDAFFSALDAGRDFAFRDAVLGPQFSAPPLDVLAFTFGAEDRLWTAVPRIAEARGDSRTTLVGSELEALFPNSKVSLAIDRSRGMPRVTVGLADKTTPEQIEKARQMALTAGVDLVVSMKDGPSLTIMRTQSGLVGRDDTMSLRIEALAEYLVRGAEQTGLSVDGKHEIEVLVQRGTLSGYARFETFIVVDGDKRGMLVEDQPSYPELMPTKDQMLALVTENGKAISQRLGGPFTVSFNVPGEGRTKLEFDNGALAS